MNVRAISVSRKETMKKYLFLASFLIVPLFLLIAFTLLPAVGVFGVGFLYWDGIGDPEFVGFRNFARIFSKAEYWQAFLNSGYYLVGAIVQLALALFLAALLTFPMLHFAMIASSSDSRKRLMRITYWSVPTVTGRSLYVLNPYTQDQPSLQDS